MSALLKDLDLIWHDATTSKTWWHQVAAYAALVVAALDPGSTLSTGIQAALIAFGTIVIGLDVNGKHQTAKAIGAAQALASNTKTLTIQSQQGATS